MSSVNDQPLPYDRLLGIACLAVTAHVAIRVAPGSPVTRMIRTALDLVATELREAVGYQRVASLAVGCVEATANRATKSIYGVSIDELLRGITGATPPGAAS